MFIVLPLDLDAVPRKQLNVEIRLCGVATEISIRAGVQAKVYEPFAAIAFDRELGRAHRIALETQPTTHQLNHGEVKITKSLPFRAEHELFQLRQVAFQMRSPHVELANRAEMLASPRLAVIDLGVN